MTSHITTRARSRQTALHAPPQRPAACWAAPVLAAALSAALVACGGGNSGSEGTSAPDGSTPTLEASQPGDLTAHVQRLLRERAAARLAGQPPSGAGSLAPVPSVGAAPATTTAFSSSLTQEQGVDEPDLVKTDGTHLFSLDLQDGAKPLLRITRRTSTGALEERSAQPLALGAATTIIPRGLVTSADTKALAVASDGWVGTANPCADLCPPILLPPTPVWLRSLVAVERFDVADPARPAATTRLEFDGRLIDARRVGDHLVLVSEYQPMLAADQLPTTASMAERDAAIAATQGRDLLPLVRAANGSTRALVSDTDCWVQPANASLTLAVTTITVLDLRAGDLAPASRCFVGGTEALYMTPQSIYLASTRSSYVISGSVLRYPATMRTDLHKFAFAAGSISYRGSGEVAGHLGWDALRKSYRLSEHEGVLRVLSFTGTLGWFSINDASTTPPSPATLTMLREAANGSLGAIATLPNAQRPQALGKAGEQVHGVRFAGTRGYLVTFRQIDPLYVLDLADAADPRVAGVLEAPGFSDHLLPLPNQLLLGVGKDADASGRAGGVKVSLFDVADASRPRELASRAFGAAGSQSGLDSSRQGLTLLEQGGVMRVATPLFLFDAGFTHPRDGLQRLEVDLAARTLAAKPLLTPGAGALPDNLANQRSVMIGEQVYWLRGGRLIRNDW